MPGPAAEYKSARAACGSLAGNAKDICRMEASGAEKVAKAGLEARHKPSANATYNVRVARAGAEYAVAKEKCDDMAGNVKDVCLKEAKAVSVASRADATVQKKTASANEKAAAASAKANRKADGKTADAQDDAASDKRKADYAVAREKCDAFAFASDAKNACMSNAKARFGQS